MSQAIKLAEPEEAETPDGKQIYVLMSRVMADIGYISKGRKNEQQHYQFRGIDDVSKALQPALIKHGIFYVPEVLKSEREERATKSGGVLIYTTLLVAYTFYAPDGSSVHAVVVGEGMDSGDKSSNKAMSAALKYAVLQIFCVPTESTPDADNDSPNPTPKAREAVKTSAGKPLVDPQSPIQSEKDALSDYVKKGCGILNEAGDDIHWTPKTLTSFIKERFQVPNGLVDLTVEQLQEMKQEMHGRLDRLEAKKALMGVE